MRRPGSHCRIISDRNPYSNIRKYDNAQIKKDLKKIQLRFTKFCFRVLFHNVDAAKNIQAEKNSV